VANVSTQPSAPLETPKEG